MTTAATPAPAAAGTPELITHEWSPEGTCLNPERVALDFGAKGGMREAIILLGARPDGSWRFGYTVALKNADEKSEPCAKGDILTNRRAALRNALLEVGTIFNQAKDKIGAAAVDGYFEKHFSDVQVALPPIEGNVADHVLLLKGYKWGDGSPANTSGPTFPLLPRGKFEPELSIAQIQRNPDQPRRTFDPVALRELAESMRSGQLQPIAVRRLALDELGEIPAVAEAAGGTRYELILGERRWRAKQLLGETTIEAKVYEGLTRAQAKAAALIENLQRENLNPIEEAEGFRDLMAAEQLTQEQCAARVGRSRPVVANALRVLDLPARVVDLIREKKLTVAHGVALARFKAWPKVVEIMADEAAVTGLTASVLEKGLPCVAALQRAGVMVSCNAHQVDTEFPASIKKHPAYFKQNDWLYYCLEPEHWQNIVAEFDQERKRQAAEREAKERKAAEKAAKGPTKIKSLEDLPRGSFAVVSDTSLLPLMPDSATADVKTQAGGNVTICTKPDLAEAINAAVAKIKAEDRKAKLPRMFGQASAAVAATKKLGPREMVPLFYAASTCDLVQLPCLSDRAAKYRGVKLPAKAFSPDYEGQIELTSAGLSALTEVEPLKLWKVMITDWLMRFEDDALDCDYNLPPDADSLILIRWILDTDTLGLLEETKAGQKQILKTVENSAEYQAALATAKGAAKTSKKGSK